MTTLGIRAGLYSEQSSTNIVIICVYVRMYSTFDVAYVRTPKSASVQRVICMYVPVSKVVNSTIASYCT